MSTSNENNSQITFQLDDLRGSDRAPLHRTYPGQHQPQDAFVSLDSDGCVRADYSSEIGNAVSSDVWHKRELHFPVSPSVCGHSLADFLESPEGRGLLERIHAGHELYWDGSNYVGILTADAENASDVLCATLSNLKEIVVCDAGSFFFNPCVIRDLWNEGETLAEAAARNYADSETHDADYSVEGGESATYEAFLVEAVLCVQHPNYLDQITPAQAAHLYEIGAVDLDSYNEWREVNDDCDAD